MCSLATLNMVNDNVDGKQKLEELEEQEQEKREQARLTRMRFFTYAELVVF